MSDIYERGASTALHLGGRFHCHALVAQGFRVTRLASTGGFLRRGNTTLLVGLEETEIDRAKNVVHAKAPGSFFIALDLDRYERL